MTKVSLIGASPVAHLKGDEGHSSIVENGDEFFLQGDFSLVVFGFVSGTVEFSPFGPDAAQVEQRGEEWVLVSLRSKTTFEFASPIEIRRSDGDGSVRSRFSVLSLRQLARQDAVALLSFEDISASLVTDVFPNNSDDSRKITVPSASGAVAIDLLPRDWPGQTQNSGFYLKTTNAGDLVISLGSLRSVTDLGGLKAFNIGVGTGAEVLLSPGGHTREAFDPLLSFEPIYGNPLNLRISTADDPLIRFASSPKDDSKTRLRLQRIEAFGHKLSLNEFDDEFLDVRATKEESVRSDGFGETRVFGPGSRFSFDLELTEEARITSARAQLVYRDEIGTTSARSSAERFYGVRLRGMGDVRGIQPALDSSFASFDFDHDEQQCFLKSGGELQDVNGTSISSLLMPKLDHVTNERQLNLPVDDIALRVQADADGMSPMLIDTALAQFSVSKGELVAPPVGISAFDDSNRADSGYAEWLLKYGPNDPIVFKISDDGIQAPDPSIERREIASGELEEVEVSWLEKFETKHKDKEYTSVQHQELKVKIDSQNRENTEVKKTKVKKLKDPSDKEILAYTAFFATLSYAAIELINALTDDKVIGDKQLDIDLEDLKLPEDGSYVIRNGLKDLVVAYNLATHKEEFKRLVLNNAPQGGHKRLLLPLSSVVGLVLYEYDEDTDTYIWADELAETLKPYSSSSFSIDFSSKGGLSPADVGFSEDSWADIASEAKALWPKARNDDGSDGKDGSRLDPSDDAWRGFFVHDMPASVILPKEVIDSIIGEAPVVKELFDLLLNKLFLHYAWRDASGATFSASLVDEKKITPDSWDDFLSITVKGLSAKGAPLDGATSGVVQAEGTIEVVFPWWTDNGQPLTAEGFFQLDLTKKDPVKEFKVRLSKPYSGVPAFPGIKEMRLIDWELDLKTLKAVVGIKGDEKLAKLLPFIDEDKEIVGTIFFDLGEEPSSQFNLVLPTEIETKFSGKWNCSVTAIALSWDGEGDQRTFQTRFRCRIDMGIPVLSSVGLDITVYSKDDGDWELDVELQEIGIKLELGDMSFEGSALWERVHKTDEVGSRHGESLPKKSERIRSDLVAEAGREREFFLALEARGGLFGDGWKLFGKSGSKGGMVYWIGGVVTDLSVNLGSMQLQDPSLLLAHNADHQGKLKKHFASVGSSIDGVLRPLETEEAKLREWLDLWGPSTDIGTLVAASGYLNAHSQVAKAPSKDPINLTSIAYSDQGMFRVDAKVKLFGALDARFALTIDTVLKYIEAGLQIGKFSLPPGGSEYEIHPGLIVLGTSYGNESKRFTIGLGWPEKTGQDEFERDWTKATKVKISGLVPVNTFWGGIKAEVNLKPNPKYVYLGIAVRAGWTWSYEINGADIAKASAELGVAVGGVFEFQLTWEEADAEQDGRSAQPTLQIIPTRAALIAEEAIRLTRTAHKAIEQQIIPPSKLRDDELARINACISLMETSAARLERLDVQVSATLYGDVWGSASLEFLGVTIAAISVRAYARFQICGSLNSGITVMRAAVGFEVSITILCVTYKTSARIDIVLRDEGCSFGSRELQSANVLLPPSNGA